MRKILAAMVFVFFLPISQPAKEDSNPIVLPNPKLLTCKFSDCSQLWSYNVAATVFPKQLIIDSNHHCVYGVTALYDKEISADDLKKAVDERYEKWALPGFEKAQLKLWRVEPEKFSIQLSVADKNDEKKRFREAGTKQLIYIAFGGRAACATR